MFNRNYERLRVDRLVTPIVIVVVAACIAVAAIRGCYYQQLNAVDSILSEHPEIDQVWLSMNDDFTLEVEQVYFSLSSAPGLVYHCQGIDHVSSAKFRARLERSLREKRPVQLPKFVTKRW